MRPRCFFGLLDHAVTIEQMRIAFDGDDQRPIVGKCFAVKREGVSPAIPFSMDAVIASGWSAADARWAADSTATNASAKRFPVDVAETSPDRGKIGENLERAKGFEPSTPTLARLCSTPELRPHSAAAT